MTDMQKKVLPIILIVTGLAFMCLKGMMVLLPDAWGWEPRQHEYEGMIIGVYAVLGIFLLLASRDPEKHLSLIWFTALSSFVHAAIMLVQALNDPAETANLMPWGDVPALFLVSILMMAFTPRRLS